MNPYLKFYTYKFAALILKALSDNSFNKLLFRINCLRLNHKYYSPNYKLPKTFNEKLVYLKMHNIFPEGEVIADKVEVRNYVKQKIGEESLIPVYGVYNLADEIEYDKLPESFIIKTNHGSGWNILVKKKSEMNYTKVNTQLNLWLKSNAWDYNREWQYKNIKPKLIIEKLLGDNILDYKVFCFDGKAQFIQIDVDRFLSHTRSFYDREWRKQDFGINYPISSKEVDKPKVLNELIEKAEKLSQNLKFARVDFYIFEDTVYFGEITLHPGGGLEPFLTTDQDVYLGNYLNV